MSVAKVLAVVFSLAALAIPASGAIVFDKPLSSETATVPNKYGGTPISYTCTRYSAFVVREQVYGGATEGRFTIEPSGLKSCATEGNARDYGAYGGSAGVKGRFVIVQPAASTYSSGYFYLIDSRKGPWVQSGGIEGPLQAIDLLPDGVALRFRRVFQASCSLFYGAATACWSTVKAQTGLSDDMVPDCRPAYDDQRKKDGATGEKFNQRPSQIAYNVEVRYTGGKLSFVALPGPVACKPLY